MLSSPSALSWNLLFYTFCCPFLPGLPVTRWNCISVIKLKLINNNVPSLQTGSSWKAWWRRSSGNPGRPCEYLSLNHIFYLPYRYLDKILIWWLFLGRSRSERSHRWGRASGSAGKNNNTSTLISVCCFSCLHFIICVLNLLRLVTGGTRSSWNQRSARTQRRACEHRVTWSINKTRSNVVSHSFIIFNIRWNLMARQHWAWSETSQLSEWFLH